MIFIETELFEHKCLIPIDLSGYISNKVLYTELSRDS